MRTTALLLMGIVCAAAALPGCSSGDGGTDVSSPPADVAEETTAPADAGGPDTAPPFDAGEDAGAEDTGPTDTGPDAALPPDPATINEVRTSAVVWSDIPVAEEVATLFRTEDVLPSLDVHALAWHQSTVWAGTEGGLFHYDEDAGKFLADGLREPEVAVVDLDADGDAALAVAHPDGITVVENGDAGPQFYAVSGAAVTAVAMSAGRVWVGTGAGVGELPLDAPETLSLSWTERAVRDIAIHEGPDAPWVATDAGLLVWSGDGFVTRTAADGWLADDDVRALAVDDEGAVLAGTATGLARLSQRNGTTVTIALTAAGPQEGGLPIADVRALDARDGRWAVGHGIGATVRTPDGTTSDHYHTLRWMPAEESRAVLLDPSGRRWIGTSGGVSRIDIVERTLAEKAASMEQFLQAHHWRMDGFVASDAVFEDAWALENATLHDKDNDGLWTQMQVGAWALAGGATGDDYYCQQARKAIETMFLQIDVPAVDFEAAGLGRGFVTRSLVRDDEGDLFTSKASQSNWHLVEYEGRQYYWKDDTSSDETTGHFFGYPLYFDLCADEEERTAVADHAGALAGYILEHDFRLIDLDGQQTSHGEWYPEVLAIALDGLAECAQQFPPEDCASALGGHGWLNSIEILGHMLAAWHMTGEQRFYDAYETLVVEHRYGELVDFAPTIFTVTQPPIANHSDHELAILGYFTLLRYEPNPERRQRWIDSLLAVYEYEKPERNPLWAFLVASAVHEGAEVRDAVRTLHEIPVDVRQMPYDNSHRQDAVRVANDRFGDPQLDRVFPYDEIRTFWWNGNPYAVADGGNIRATQSPMFYLLPYWGLRYFGAID